MRGRLPTPLAAAPIAAAAAAIAAAAIAIAAAALAFPSCWRHVRAAAGQRLHELAVHDSVDTLGRWHSLRYRFEIILAQSCTLH